VIFEYNTRPHRTRRCRGALLVTGICVVALVRVVQAGPRAADLEYAKANYVLQSGAFSAQAREQAVRYINSITATADAMTREQYLLSVLRIVALADNGHDAVNQEEGAWYPDARLPVRMLWFPEGWVVARADPAHIDLLGARVLSIDGHTSPQVFQRLRDLNGGLDHYRRWNLEYFVENAGILHALGIARYPDRLELRLRLPRGRQVRRTLLFIPKSTMPTPQIIERLWSPAPWPGERDKGWGAVDPRPTPLYLQQGERLFRVAYLAELDALYLQMRVHFDMDGETVAGFISEVDQQLAAQHPRHLIVDLRFDTGGDIDTTREWQRTLPTRIPGRIYVLVGPYTFSAGIVAAAAFKHDAPARVRIVGDEVGDRLHWWSEGENVCLPNSHYCPHLTTGFWDLVHGCAGNPACYGDRLDARVSSLTPDLSAPLTIDSWLAGRDPGMEAIEHEMRSHATLGDR
jgi:hypothetical protein